MEQSESVNQNERTCLISSGVPMVGQFLSNQASRAGMLMGWRMGPAIADATSLNQ